MKLCIILSLCNQQTNVNTKIIELFRNGGVAMKKVVVTGGSGLLGTDVIKEFLDNGYEVVNADMKYPKQALCRTVITDLTNLGEVYGVLAGADAVIHLAAIPVA